MEQSTKIQHKNKGGRPRRLDKLLTPKRPPGRPKGRWITYAQARAFARQFRFNSYKEWVKYAKKRDKKTGKRLKPIEIPTYPHVAYKGKGWIGVDDFLGIGSARYFPYEKSKIEARKLRLKSARTWFKWWATYKPVTVPRNPQDFYVEWEDWNTFLGNKNLTAQQKSKQHISYKEAQKLIHQLKLKHKGEYRQWHAANKPKHLPSHPEDRYKNKGWVSWKDWLGTSLIARLESKKNNTAVLYIAHHNNMPNNVFEIVVDNIGKQSVIEKQRQTGFTLIKIYKAELEIKPKVDGILLRYCRGYWEGNRQFIVNNLPQMLFELDEILLWA